VRPGHEAALINVSQGGALIETLCRLVPGAAIDLQFTTGEGRVSVRGRVLRCAVAHLRPSGVFYRGAIAFERSLPWPPAATWQGYGVPHGEGRQPAERATHDTRPLA
jgi:hypothetical protein